MRDDRYQNKKDIYRKTSLFYLVSGTTLTHGNHSRPFRSPRMPFSRATSLLWWRSLWSLFTGPLWCQPGHTYQAHNSRVETRTPGAKNFQFLTCQGCDQAVMVTIRSSCCHIPASGNTVAGSLDGVISNYRTSDGPHTTPTPDRCNGYRQYTQTRTNLPLSMNPGNFGQIRKCATWRPLLSSRTLLHRPPGYNDQVGDNIILPTKYFYYREKKLGLLLLLYLMCR